MVIASASKWPFAAYVVQREHGRLTPQQISMLGFTSGYTRLRFCFRWQTVDGCLRRLGYGDRIDSEIGKFHYSSGHMQHLAAQLGLGAAVRGELGDNIHFVYTQPQPAGSMAMNAASYARFLRGMMDGRLLLGRLLDADAASRSAPLGSAAQPRCPHPTRPDPSTLPHHRRNQEPPMQRPLILASSLAIAMVLTTASAQDASAGSHGNAGSRSQRLARIQQMLEQHFAQADSNHDGKLTLAEAKAGMPRVAESFDKIDTARRGYVTLRELDQYLLQQARQRRAQQQNSRA